MAVEVLKIIAHYFCDESLFGFDADGLFEGISWGFNFI